MKIRFVLLVAALLLALSACSLAEDVTPPPQIAPSAAAPTQTKSPASPTAAPATATTAPPSATPAATDAAVDPNATAPAEAQTTDPTAEASATPAIPTGPVSGRVVSGSEMALPSGLSITLRGFDLDADSNATESVHNVGTLSADGSYLFENVEVPAGRIFLVELTASGVLFQSDYIFAETPPVSLPDLTFFEISDDPSLLTLDKVHVALDYSTVGLLKVVEMYIISNTSSYAVKVDTDGTSIPFIQLPEGAANVDFQVASGSAAFTGTQTGFALVPMPAEQQYGLVAVFELPYEKRMTLDLPFSLPVTSLSIFVPEGVKVRAEGLIDMGTETYSEATYHLYDMAEVPAGSTLSVKLSGSPDAGAAVPGTASTTQKWLIIGLGTGGMALIGLGMFLFMRDRKRKEEEEEDEGDLEVGEQPLGELADEPLEGATEETPQEQTAPAELPDQDAVLDAIIALDDQFKSGSITKDVYDKRRAELKEQLRKQI